MKTRILLALILLAALTGCGERLAAFTQAGTRDGASSALAENQRELYGKVTAANGNEITLALGALSEEQDASRGEAAREDGAGEPPDGGGLSKDGGGAPDSKGNAAQGRRAQTSLALTGEEETFLIPVGTPVYMTSGGAVITQNFMQIMVDNTICLVLLERNGEETVVSATIL